VHVQRKIMMKAGRALVATVLVAGLVASCSESEDRKRNTAFTTLPDGVGTDSTVPATPTDSTLSGETSTTVASSDSTLPPTTGEYAVGDTGPGGGVVFFIDAESAFPDFDYLEAAPANWNGADGDPSVAWCSNMTTKISASKNAVGAGAENTSAASTCTNSAAAKASAFTGAGKSDWFLPSKDELKLLFNNLADNSLAGLSGGVYWSSTSSSDTRAWAELMSDGTQGTNFRTSSFLIRPVRAFK
jgi:hypothetical protein